MFDDQELEVGPQRLMIMISQAEMMSIFSFCLDELSGLRRQNSNRWLNHSDVNGFLGRAGHTGRTSTHHGQAADLCYHDLALRLYNHDSARMGSGGM